MCGIHNSCDYEYSVKLACATNSLIWSTETFEKEKVSHCNLYFIPGIYMKACVPHDINVAH